MIFPAWPRIQYHFGNPRHPRLLVDASSFDPKSMHQNGRAVLLIIRNAEDTIFQRVRDELKCSSGVVVLDLGSKDATPYLAAEAGAVVVLQSDGIDREDALCRALSVARRFSEHVTVIEL